MIPDARRPSHPGAGVLSSLPLGLLLLPVAEARAGGAGGWGGVAACGLARNSGFSDNEVSPNLPVLLLPTPDSSQWTRVTSLGSVSQ